MFHSTRQKSRWYLLRCQRRRLLLTAATMLLGLASRRYASGLPGWVGAYAGDALWALLVYWLVGLARPRWSGRQQALAAGGFALLIELSQLWQAPWLQALRHTTLGALVLGQGFLWSDLACYAVGIATGGFLDSWARPDNGSLRAHRRGRAASPASAAGSS